MKTRTYLIAALIVLASAGILLTQEATIRIAVIPFDDGVTAEGEAEKAGPAASSAIRQAIAGVDRFFVREASAIQEYINKLILVQAGTADPDSLKGQSENLKVNYLTVGTVSKFEGLYDADARTVNIDTWVIVHSHGSTAATLSEALGNIGWSMKNQFTREYLKDRDEDMADRPVLSVGNFSDFNALAMKKGYAGAFSEILNSQLGSFILISTVEGKYAKALLEEKSLEMAGVIGNDGGGGLNVKGIQYQLTGDIRVFNDLICINYRLSDTADGRVVLMGSKEIGTRKGLRPAAWSISSEIEDVLNNRIGTLKISSTPPAAEVFLDGSSAGTTPLVISLAGGNHALKLKLLGYKSHEETLAVTAKTVTEKSIALSTVSTELLMKAMLLERQGKWNDAVGTYQAFIDEYGESYESNNALYRKGHVLLVNVKDYGKALATFTALVNRYPDTMTRAEAYYGMIKTYIAMNNKDKAKEIVDYLKNNYPEAYATEEARNLQL